MEKFQSSEYGKQQIESYAISQTTLEQIFIRFASKQLEIDLETKTHKESGIEKTLSCLKAFFVVN